MTTADPIDIVTPAASCSRIHSMAPLIGGPSTTSGRVNSPAKMVGEAYSGAIDFILRKPRVAKHGRGSLVR